jgi:hypothetical protein
MSGAIPLLPLYVFMVWAEVTFTATVISKCAWQMYTKAEYGPEE